MPRGSSGGARSGGGGGMRSGSPGGRSMSPSRGGGNWSGRVSPARSATGYNRSGHGNWNRWSPNRRPGWSRYNRHPWNWSNNYWGFVGDGWGGWNSWDNGWGLNNAWAWNPVVTVASTDNFGYGSCACAGNAVADNCTNGYQAACTVNGCTCVNTANPAVFGCGQVTGGVC